MEAPFKVVCINNGRMEGSYRGHLLTVGKQYTVIDILNKKAAGVERVHYVLAEVDPETYCFRAERFAPIEEQRESR